MKFIKCILVFFLLFSFYTCCKKKSDDEPKPKPEPNDEMTAKVNGTDWKSCKPGLLGGTTSDVSAQYFVGWYLDVDGLNTCNNTPNLYTEVYLKIFGISDTGTFLLGGTSSNIGHCNTPSTSIVYSTDSIHIGIVTINEFDTTKLLISGTFQFDAYNKDSNRIVKVTDGKLTKVNFYKF